MINVYSERNTVSFADILNTLAVFMDNGSYDNDGLLCFVSYLTGVSEDKICETIQANNLPENKQEMEPVPVSHGLTRERLVDILHSYVNNDAEATEDSAYVIEALSQAGCSREDAEELGLGWIWS